MGAPNLTGTNGPRNPASTGRLRNTLMNLASKQRVSFFPQTLVFRGNDPNTQPPTARQVGAPLTPGQLTPGPSGLSITAGQSGLSNNPTLPDQPDFTGGLTGIQQSIADMLKKLGTLDPTPGGGNEGGLKEIPNPPKQGQQPPPPGHFSNPNILATIRHFESGGSYTARARYSTASGAYQFTDATWNHFGGYAHAYQAPAAVQDRKAAMFLASIQRQFGSDPKWAFAAWYAGLYGAAHKDWDKIPAPHNRYTIQQLVDMRLRYLMGL
jgi:hypothetical protein